MVGLGPSALGRALAALAAAATLGLVFATPLGPELRALISCSVALGLLRALRILGAPHHLRVEGESEVTVDARRGRLAPGSFVAPWLTSVRWRPEGAWFDRAVLILPDMLPAEDFRRLRVLLKCGASSAPRGTV